MKLVLQESLARERMGSGDKPPSSSSAASGKLSVTIATTAPQQIPDVAMEDGGSSDDEKMVICENVKSQENGEGY